jgi:prepilin-type N-terminal cleavage/methylation domain-containing protein/prepilin-type processing-associated H-X9-DG protein
MRTRGFTLVELLVVIAVVGMLVALLLPAIQASRAAARCTQCKSNLHNLGIGMLNFIDTHNGNFPFTYHSGNTKTWIVTVSPWIEDVDSIRLCPDDPKGPDRVNPTITGLRGTSYVINEYVSYKTSDGFSVLNINKMTDTNRVIVLFEGANEGRGVKLDHVHCSNWYSPGDIAMNQVWETILAEINPTQHRELYSNYLFADGHVETVSHETFGEWVQRDVDNRQAGMKTNFTRPNNELLD